MKKIKKFWFIFLISIAYFVINAVRIYKYSLVYVEDKSDVAIVLGAGTVNGVLSPVFRERIHHGIYLLKKGLIDKLILTGGVGDNQRQSDSKIAKLYALKKGVLADQIIIEEASKFTFENIIEAKQIMDVHGFKTALIVSDPLHMKRAMKLTKVYGVTGSSSPTKTTMYRSRYTKAKFLMSETLYFTLRELKSVF